jgi:hypothetical protein
VTDATPINDEEPSPDSMDRLWSALDAALDPPNPPPLTSEALRRRVGQHSCLRCGWHWCCNRCRRDPFAHSAGGAPQPKCCANIICRSTYWDQPAKTVRGRRPEDTDWVKVREAMAAARVDRKRRRHLAKARSLAKELGLDIRDPRPRRRTKKFVREEAVLAAVTPAQVAAAEATQLRDSLRALVRGRTVPPPPGLDELEGTK